MRYIALRRLLRGSPFERWRRQRRGHRLTGVEGQSSHFRLGNPRGQQRWLVLRAPRRQVGHWSCRSAGYALPLVPGGPTCPGPQVKWLVARCASQLGCGSGGERSCDTPCCQASEENGRWSETCLGLISDQPVDSPATHSPLQHSGFFVKNFVGRGRNPVRTHAQGFSATADQRI
jgi:hypothetical protein